MEVKSLGYNFSHKKGEFCKKRICDFYSLCCFSTPFVYLKDGVLLRGNAGDILINPPGEIVYHGPVTGAVEGFINDWFQILGKDFEELLNLYPLPLNIAFSVGRSDFLRSEAIKISEEIANNLVGKNQIINAYVTEMIIKIFRKISPDTANKTNNAIDKTRHEMLTKPELDWNLSKMAKISGYSVSRFCELYKSTYKTTPINDIINERIVLAKRLLSSGQLSILAVSEACGFSTVSYFSKCFKKITGYTPGSYRE